MKWRRDGYNLLDGFRHGNEDTTEASASSNWNHLDHRMNFIAALFQSNQLNPALFENPF